MNITQTSQQSTAVDLMLHFATKQTEQRMFLLEGHAGTGKTTTWWRFYTELIQTKQRYFVAVSAPTNKAVGVLEKLAPPNVNRVEFSTIHRLLGLVSEIDREGHEVFKVDRKCDKRASFAAFDLILIDEASMINFQLWKLLLEAMERYTDVKIIFVSSQ